MLRSSRFSLLVFVLFLIQGPANAQDDAEVQAPNLEQAQQQATERRERIQELRRLSQEEREVKRAERQRQIDSLTEEQRQALRERRQLREANARHRGQRPQRRRPPVTPSQAPQEPDNEAPS